MNKKLIAVLLSGLIAGSFMTVSANAEEHTISVTGNARILIPADTATFYATVETYSPDAKVASRENAVIMNKVKKAVILAGAIESKLETDSYYFYIEIKDNGDNSVENKGKNKAAKEHFKRLNEKLSANGTSEK